MINTNLYRGVILGIIGGILLGSTITYLSMGQKRFSNEEKILIALLSRLNSMSNTIEDISCNVNDEGSLIEKIKELIETANFNKEILKFNKNIEKQQTLLDNCIIEANFYKNDLNGKITGKIKCTE
ncbi:hypothetical protein [Rhodospirillum rubrum]|uniref:hypothetical protein n=1 Tax=Rhodospirillum rubrum TaxID=1085 RepID=UPI0011D1EDC2|nr:hypothetical protein [Rhodospirillum rubrum]QXG78857.1 hypothetical protein KUL73_10695 [Rhodospirillum rubrum]